MSEAAEIDVLHVDDEPDFVELAADMLKREDSRFSIETATSASNGIDRLTDEEFDCIVSDYDMPGTNGIEFLQAVREECPELPFILYTGKGSEEVAADAISAGVTDYLQKESGTEQYAILANRIRNAVSAHWSAIAAEQNRHQLEQTLKTVPSCVVRLDPEGQFVFANDRAVEVLGLEKDELTDRTYNDPEWEIADLDGDPIPDEKLPFRQVRDSGEPLYGFRHTIKWPDGSEKVLLVNGAPLLDTEGEVDSVIFSLTDITDQMEYEQRLRQATARLEALFENSPDMINIHDMEGNIIDPNPPLCEETGYDADELTEMKVWEIDQAIDPDEARTMWNGMDQGDRRRLEGVYQRRDGSEFPVEVHVRRLNVDERDRFMVISRDIAERKRRERTLREFQHRTEDLIRASSQKEIADIAVATARDVLGLSLSGVHLADHERNVLEPTAVTDEVREHLGEAPAYDQENPERSVDGLNWEVFEAGETVVIEDTQESDWSSEAETPSRSGIILPLGDHGLFLTSSPNPHAFDEGDVSLLEIFATIVTAVLDRNERETTLRTRTRRLKSQNERLDDFAGIVSHDLRNPLKVAQGRLELAREEHDNEHLEVVARSHSRMNDLIEDLLELARVGEMVSEMETIDLAEVVEDSWQNLDTTDAKIRINTSQPISADRHRLQQLLENLFRNAVEHGGIGVTVTVGDLDRGFYIEDDGDGIPEDEREDVFDTGYTTSQQGTGFGLNIVKQLVDAHGWEIRVADGSRGGARFEITDVEFAAE